MQQLREQDGVSQEIDLFDVSRFFGRNKKAILGGGFFGLAIALAWSWMAPPVYEADVIMKMAQAPIANANTNANISATANINTIGDVETPALLMERLKNPATYTEKSIKACAPDGMALLPEDMVRLIKVTVNKVTSTVLISVRRNNPELAGRCLHALFEMISEQQAELKQQRDLLVKNALSVSRGNLKEYQNTFKSIAKPDQATAVLMMGELAGFINQINQAEIMLSLSEPTRLISAAYPQLKDRRAVFIAGGGALGVLLGLVWALLAEVTRKRQVRQAAA